MVKISIIIPAWSLWKITKECLESIAQSCEKDALLDVIEVIVVGSSSHDGTQAELQLSLQALFGKHGHHIPLSRNEGFAKSCNLGAKVAKGSLLFFLNSCITMTDGSLPLLLQALERNPKLGMVSPLLLYPNNKVHNAGICFKPDLELTYAHHLIPASYVIPLKQRFWQAITGVSLLMPKQIFQDCHGFHEGYNNGFEDLDLCCRVREKGYKITVVHDSIVYTRTNSILETSNQNENKILFEQRCHDCFAADLHIVATQMNLEPKFTPDLEMYVGLPSAKESAYTLIFTENFDENRCIARLNTDPYWLGGYEILATFYEKGQRWTEAIDIRLQQSHLVPVVKNFASLAYCAANAGNTELVSSCKQFIHDITRKIHDIEALRHKAFSIQETASKNDDTTLKELVEQWIEESPL